MIDFTIDLNESMAEALHAKHPHVNTSLQRSQHDYNSHMHNTETKPNGTTRPRMINEE
jgi:hypothetical protein